MFELECRIRLRCPLNKIASKDACLLKSFRKRQLLFGGERRKAERLLIDRYISKERIFTVENVIPSLEPYKPYRDEYNK